LLIDRGEEQLKIISFGTLKKRRFGAFSFPVDLLFVRQTFARIGWRTAESGIQLLELLNAGNCTGIQKGKKSMDQAAYQQLSEDYQRIEQALLFLQSNFHQQPTLGEVAARVGLSEYHFQRLFQRWVGISPKRFLQFLTKEYACHLLEKSITVLEAAYAAGLSGPGRLHDLLVSSEAVTPGEVRRRGEGLEIRYGMQPSPFGECLAAFTGRGICFLAFGGGEDQPALLGELQRRWPQAQLVEDAVGAADYVAKIFPLAAPPRPIRLALHLQGTNFQLKVWEALMRIPPGKLVTYEDLAVHLGQPQAARAVSRAVAENPIAVLIPCHRVIRKLGVIGGYRWGPARKQALIGWEMAHSAA